MKKVQDIQVADLLPEYLKGDKKFKALNQGIEEVLSEWTESIDETIIYDNIENLNEDMINELIWEWHVDFVDEKTTLEEKKKLLQTSWSDHETKGTPVAVESALNNVFNDVEVYEWFQYDGMPYTFKLILGGGLPDLETIARIFTAVNLYKNERSHLTGLRAVTHNFLDISHGAAIIDSGRKIDYPAGGPYGYKKYFIQNNFVGAMVSLTRTVNQVQEEKNDSN